MRSVFTGLRAGILTQLIFLIIAAMLLVNVVMTKFAERDLIKSAIDSGILLLKAIEQNTEYYLTLKNKTLDELDNDPFFAANVKKLLDPGNCLGVVINDKEGKQVFSDGLPDDLRELNLTFARNAMGTNLQSINYTGSIWGVLWLNNREVHISAPLKINNRVLGGISVSIGLESVFKVLRRSEKFIIFYIILDTIILGIVGIYLLSRIVVNPIHKLLKMTEEYKDGNIIEPFVETTKNEISDLSRSLSIMLTRLEENKRELKAHITSLEKANKELKQAQAEIIRTEKLASIGRLAAGIAHEIGNPIGIILGYLDLIKKGNLSSEEKHDFLTRVEGEIIRINLIIRQLLDFSRKSHGEKVVINIHELIESTLDILRPQPGMDEIRIEMNLSAKRTDVYIDSNQLQQVFLNIVMNSVDALKTAEANKDPDKEKYIAILSENIGNLIEIRVTDNGIGISLEELDHIFDPFFTTKEPGRGTGLGLYVSYMIIEDQGGKIFAESVPGEGTSIIIDLPLCSTETEHVG